MYIITLNFLTVVGVILNLGKESLGLEMGQGKLPAQEKCALSGRRALQLAHSGGAESLRAVGSAHKQHPLQYRQYSGHQRMWNMSESSAASTVITPVAKDSGALLQHWREHPWSSPTPVCQG
ncbi:hypothetical protein MHYP_G00298420 [Metynnis hypsauchen]